MKWRWLSASLGLMWSPLFSTTIAADSLPQCIYLYCQPSSQVSPQATTLQLKGQHFVWKCITSDRGGANDINPRRDVLDNSWGLHLHIQVVRAMPKLWPWCWHLLNGGRGTSGIQGYNEGGKGWYSEDWGWGMHFLLISFFRAATSSCRIFSRHSRASTLDTASARLASLSMSKAMLLSSSRA